MRRFYFLALMALVFLGLGLLVSCGDDVDDDSSDDDDDDSSDDDDDDGGDDDDDDSGSDGEVWTDSNTGLMWHVPALSAEDGNAELWQYSSAFCQNLDYAGYTDWRLPSIGELRSIIRGCPATETGGECLIDDGCLTVDCFEDYTLCDGCESCEGPSDGYYWPEELTGLGCDNGGAWTWSSTEVPEDSTSAFLISFESGHITSCDKFDCTGMIRCVRN